jgi:hypothetical protein
MNFHIPPSIRISGPEVPARKRHKPRSKKRRIQNKWRNDPRNWEVVDITGIAQRVTPEDVQQKLSNVGLL